MDQTTNTFIQIFSEGVATKEGFFKHGKIQTVSQRLNNPCDLRHWKDKNGEPYPEINGYVNFPDVATGWAAGRAQCRINIIKRKLTFREFFCGKPGIYDGFAQKDGENDPLDYARFVLAYVKQKLRFGPEVTVDTPIYSLIPGGTK